MRDMHVVRVWWRAKTFDLTRIKYALPLGSFNCSNAQT